MSETSRLLREAAAKITEAKQRLDRRSRTCRCCGLTLFTDPVQARVFARLEHLPQKLEGIASHLEDGTDTERRSAAIEEGLHEREDETRHVD